jgi:hypothetical protein
MSNDREGGMQLFYYQPDGHGPVSFYVMAESSEAAAAAVNGYRHKVFANNKYPNTYAYGAYDFQPSHFVAAGPGEVVENDNI